MNWVKAAYAWARIRQQQAESGWVRIAETEGMRTVVALGLFGSTVNGMACAGAYALIVRQADAPTGAVVVGAVSQFVVMYVVALCWVLHIRRLVRQRSVERS